MKGYQGTRSEILQRLKVKEENGLSTYEAEKRIEKFGKNELPRKKQEPLVLQFLKQFQDPMVLILICASILSMFMQEVIDSIIILSVVVCNAIIGFAQEYKAEKALEALEKLSTPQIKVRRDGFVQMVDSTMLALGDIVELESGNYVPADVRLLHSHNLKVEESVLTGESESVEKDAEVILKTPTQIHLQKNMLFMSTFVTSGSASGVVCVNAKDSEVGKVAALLESEKKEKTPLQQRLQLLSKYLGALALLVCICMFFIYFFQGREWLEILLLSVSLAVAAIPEGLLAVVSIVLAMGVSNMSKEKAIIRQLHAVETLGSVSVICSDKTGTLTQNKMKVVEVYDSSFQHDTSEEMLMNMALCNNVHVKNKNIIGESTEKALVEYAYEHGFYKEELLKEWNKIDEIEFDSTRKRMMSIHKNHQRQIGYVKGALESVLPLCTYIYVNKEAVLLTNAVREKIKKKSEEMSSKSLRVLALAQKNIYHTHPVNDENNLVFTGLVGLMDPPREGVKESIRLCHKAGIQVNMITGDNALTAFAIAKDLHIAQKESEVLNGKEMELLSDEQLCEKIKNYRVFARVSPKDKVRIVNALKKQGEVVAMSGDGVNDAPALKRADIGVAMGKNGSDVCKQCSDMILSDDNFSTIVKAVEEGRNIYLNIQKAILYLLSCNLGEIMALFLSSVCMPNVVSTLSAVQILWVNLITDCFPALSLGVDPKDRFIMDEKPRNPKESMFANGGISFTILNGLLIGTMSIVAFRYGLNHDETLAQTMAFMVLSISQLIHSLNLSSRTHSILEVGIFKNRWLVLTIVIGILIEICVCHIPFLQNMLDTCALSLYQWGIVFVLSSATLALNEISKWVAKEK